MTERARRTRPLAEGSALQQALLSVVREGISEVVFVVGVEPDGYVFTWVNRAFLEATGLEEGQVVDRRVQDVIPSPSNEVVLGKYDLAVREGRKVSWEEVSEYPAGTKVGLVSVQPVLDADGTSRHLIGTVRDVTEERAALETAERTRDMVLETGRMARVGGWEVDLESDRVTWTDVTRMIHGVAHDHDLMVEEALDFFPGEARDRLERAIREAIHEGEPYDLELPFIDAAGRHLWVRTIGKPDHQDGVCVRLHGTFQDITSGKRRECDLAAKEAMLSRTELLAGVGSWEWDLETGHVEWSEGLYRIHGLDPTESAPAWEDQKSLYAHDDFERLAARVQECVRDGTPFRVELRVVREDGEVRHCVARGQREQTADGRDRLVGSLEDVTERVRNEKERQELQAQLHHAQKVETIGRLAGGVAHDLNNILTVIDGNMGLLRGKLPVGSAVEGEVDEVVDATARAAELTRQLLAFSRKQVLESRNIDVGKLVQDMKQLLERLVPERIDFTVSIEAGPHVVRADPAQLQQVIMNLVINAADAIEADGAIGITVDSVDLTGSDDTGIESELRPGRHVRVSVEDTGSGIDPDVVGSIFEPFFTTKPKGEGTGLGLATAYGIVRQGGGDMTVETECGEGTTFRVLLPSTTAEPEPLDTAGAGSAVRVDSQGGFTVLVVEDDPSVRRVVLRLLERCGHRACEAESGRDALEFFERGDVEVDLVISDVVMPEMDGLELRKHLKARWPALPIVLTSGYSETELEGEEDLDDVILLRKPYTLGSLQETVAQALAVST